MRVITRKEVLDLIYSEYDNADPETAKVVNTVKRIFLRMSEEEFMEFANIKMGFNLSPIRKNTYYLR